MKKTTGTNRSITSGWRPATQAVRGGTWRSEHGETSEALFLTSGYTYDDAQTVADRFAGEAAGMTYSRLQNPTVAMLEERVALMEGAEACRAQASGMAAMTTALLCQLSAGDHVVGARAAFGISRGSFLVLHTGAALRLDSVHWGKQDADFLQGVAWWVSGEGSVEGSTHSARWIVRERSSTR